MELYTILNDYIIPDLSIRFLEKGSSKDSGNNNVFNNLQSTGAIADIGVAEAQGLEPIDCWSGRRMLGAVCTCGLGLVRTVTRALIFSSTPFLAIALRVVLWERFGSGQSSEILNLSG